MPWKSYCEECAAGGIDRIFLSDHMRKLWNEIGFVPTSFVLDESDKTEDDVQQADKDATVIAKTAFQPSVKTKAPDDRDIYFSHGIIMKNSPKSLEEQAITNFLRNYGLPLSHGNNQIKNTNVIITGLSPPDVKTMFNAIYYHGRQELFFNVCLENDSI